MDDKYVIKITRKTPKLWEWGNEEETHYYQGEFNNKTIYNTTWDLAYANKFNKQETEKIIKEIKRMYEESSKNGTLLKIEVLNSETLELVNMDETIYTKFTRFEIMEI